MIMEAFAVWGVYNDRMRWGTGEFDINLHLYRCRPREIIRHGPSISHSRVVAYRMCCGGIEHTG